MKTFSRYMGILAVLVLMTLGSCQTRVVDVQKPLHDNTLTLYKNYVIQTKDAQKIKMEVIKVDSEKIYGKLKSGEQKEILRSEVREIKKTDYLASAIIAVVAIAAVIFIPI